MTKITVAEVERLAALARIGVTPDEATDLAAELDQIVGFVEQLSSVDVDGVQPTSQVTGLVDVTRPDVVRTKAANRDQLLAGAPATQDGYIKVKRVLG